MSNRLMDGLADARVVLCLGSGGVGKTTTSAALALAFADRGERVVVLTIDPARRLADALEAGESFRIQVQNKRFTVPADAEIVIEHEIDGGAEELALELQWQAEG